MKKIKSELERISIEDVHYHWRFGKGHGPSIARLETNFVAIEEALAMQLEKKSANESNDVNDRSLFDLNAILLRKVDNNKNLRPSPNANELEKNVHKEIDDDETLRHVNEPRVIKAKDRSTRAKNKKDTMSRTNKAKARSIKRDSFGFEHVEASIKASRDSGRRRERNRSESTSTLGRALRQKFVVAVEEVDDTRDVHTKYTKQTTTRKTMTTIMEAIITILEKDTIVVSSDEDGGAYEDFSDSEFNIDLNMR